MSKINGQITRLGVMGGTFDPIHYGHLQAAEGARKELDLDRVLFIPAGRPPHKKFGAVASPWQRYMMTGLAIESNDYFQLCDMELEGDQPSYTIDTVKALLGLYTGVQIFFITGADAILEIGTWKKAAELLSLCRFVAIARPGYSMDKIWSIAEAFVINPEERIVGLGIPTPDISSTEIRKRLQRGKTVKYMLPDQVIDFITEQGLYRGSLPVKPQLG